MKKLYLIIFVVVCIVLTSCSTNTKSNTKSITSNSTKNTPPPMEEFPMIEVQPNQGTSITEKKDKPHESTPTQDKNDEKTCPDGYTVIDGKCYIVDNRDYHCPVMSELDEKKVMCYTERDPICPVVKGVNNWITGPTCTQGTPVICGKGEFNEEEDKCTGYFEPDCYLSKFMMWEDGKYACVRQWDFFLEKSFDPSYSN